MLSVIAKRLYEVPNHLQIHVCLEIIITVIKTVNLGPIIPAFTAAIVDVVII